METRGRGRDSASTEQESRAPTTPARPSRPGSSRDIPQHPVTRSRTRLRTTSLRSHPSCPPHHNSSSSRTPEATISSFSSRTPFSCRPRGHSSPARPSTARSGGGSDSSSPLRQTPSQRTPSASLILPNNTSLPVSRKRTRSSTRKSLAQQSTEERPVACSSRRRRPGLTSSARPLPVSVSVSPTVNNRPVKKPRSSLGEGHHSRDCSHLQTTNVAVTGSRTSSSDRGDMDPGDSNASSGDRSQDHREARVDDIASRALSGDRAAPNTLQNLLQRLGADLNDMFPGNIGASHSRMQQLRSMISATDNEGHRLQALTELCEFLSVGTEESLVSFSVNMFVSPIVDILRVGTNVETKILAARALTHMMEALPSSSSSIASHGAAGPLCQNLLSIEYIDLAEQSLYALRKLSVDYPHQIVAARGFQAVLSFIDFFSIGVQRVAVDTACNLCRLPRAETIGMMSDVLPIMMRLLESEDQRIRESVILGYRRLAQSLQCAPAKLELLCGKKGSLIHKILRLIVLPTAPSLASESFSSAFHLLAIISRGNAALGMQILATQELILKLKERLGSNAMGHVADCLVLVDSLLPDIPELDDTLSEVRSRRRHQNENLPVALAHVEENRRNELRRDPSPLVFFGSCLLPTLMKFSNSAADIIATRGALKVMLKFIAISTKDVFAEVVGGVDRKAIDGASLPDGIQFSPFVAGLLRVNRSHCETLVGLSMASSVLQTLPSFRELFIREGVVHEIIRIAACPLRVEFSEEEGSVGIDALREGRISQSQFQVDRSTLPQNASSSTAELPHRESSVWNIVAAHQTSNSSRVARGKTLATSQRHDARELDFRISDSHYPTVLREVARSILRDHLGANRDLHVDKNVLRNTRLASLSRICKKLQECPDHSGSDEAFGRQELSSLVHLLSSPGKLSVFELSKSGVIGSLVEYLNPADLHLRSRRLTYLIKALNQDVGKGAFALLVQLSLGVLSFEENFSSPAVEISSVDSHVAVSSGLRQLAQPLKLRLRKSEEESLAPLRDYCHQVVLIEPLATIGSVEDFLWPRVARVERQNGDGSALPHLRHGRTRDQSGHGCSSGDRIGTGNQNSGEPNNAMPPQNALVGQDADRAAQTFDGSLDGAAEEIHDYSGDQNINPSDDEVSSGEEEIIGLELGDNDNQEQGQAAFEVEQSTVALPPLELHHEDLDQAPSRSLFTSDGAQSAVERRGGIASRHASDRTWNSQSYAAALAGNPSTSMDRISQRDAKSPSLLFGQTGNQFGNEAPNVAPTRLTFTMNGKVVPHDRTILSAVMQSSSREQGIGHHLWSNVHTLMYSAAEAKRDSLDSIVSRVHRSPRNAVESSVATNVRELPSRVRRSQRLIEHRQRTRAGASSSSVPAKLDPQIRAYAHFDISDQVISASQGLVLSDVPQSMACVIEFLRELRWMYSQMSKRPIENEHGPNTTLCLEGDADIQFHSNEVSAKLMHQLSNPLVLCGNVVPDWCFSLSRNASFLIPFHVRRLFFQSTSLGIARALHLMQDRVGNSGPSSVLQLGSQGGRDQETRIGRIRRQKVRIHRDRILESAVKVMSLYANHSTILEVQFFHEVGTGLGPTLEFYTLASRELQKAYLGLWRSAVPSHSKSFFSGDGQGGSISTSHITAECGQIATGSARRRRVLKTPASRQDALPITITEEQSPYIVPTGNGLFPSCLPGSPAGSFTGVHVKSAALFAFVGRLVGKAIMDGRLLDLRFSKAMCSLILAYCRVYDERVKFSRANDNIIVNNSVRIPTKFLVDAFDDAGRARAWELYTSGKSVMKLLEDVDPQLASSLHSILDMIHNGRRDSVSSLCLTFVLPGEDDQELIANGAEVEVNGDNAEEFVRRMLYHVLFRGVHRQVEALLRGMNNVLDVRGLLSFDENEIEMLVCGPSFEKWSVEFLIQTTKCDHGYSHESRAVLNFLDVLSELKHSEQQQFVLFATGSPALPVGGLGNLRPPLTIVRRNPEEGRSPDESLPTVMTCTNYFKLPDYSSREITRKQLRYAISEGQGAFHLS